MLNVKIRALAILIRTFLETAVIPTFKHSLFHSILFRYHVLGEDIDNPGYTPYYDEDFFNTIRLYHANRDICCMTIKNWYKSLLIDQVLVDQVEGLSVLKPTRLESKLLNVDWSESYRLIRLQGLDSVLSSFAFKLVHHLLPTQDRVKRLGLDQPGQNGICQICRVEVETLCHAFFECQNNLSSGKYLLTLTQKLVPG